MDGERMEPPPGRDVGAHMAAELVKNLVLANENMKKSQEILTDVRELLDELCGHFSVLGRTMEIVAEKRAEGKTKLTLADFVDAWIEADEEILGEEEGGDEHGEEDPLVPGRR